MNAYRKRHPTLGEPASENWMAPESDFVKYAKFGVIDNGILVISALAGFSLDDLIAKHVGVEGYGALVGAVVGNAISDAVAGLPEGRQAALGVFLGAMLPVLPVAAAMGLKRPLNRQTSLALGAVSSVMLVFAFIRRRSVVLEGFRRRDFQRRV
jgi:hypothetical protein